MSLLRLRSPVLTSCWRTSSRFYASKSKPAAKAPSTPPPAPPSPTPATAKSKADSDKTLKSSCVEGTELNGMRWLKDQGPVLAKADDEYPDWLWTLLQPKQLPDDGPGGKAEKLRLRKLNRQKIRERNFMSTQ